MQLTLPSPELLEAFLNESVPPRRRRRPFEIWGVTAFDDGGFFRRHLIVEVCAGWFDTRLERASHPPVGSTGLFAWDGATLRYLNRSVMLGLRSRRIVPGTWSALEAVLRDERRAPSEADPDRLAELVAAGPLLWARYIRVVGRTVQPAAFGLLEFALNLAAFDRYRDRVVPAAISGDERVGWTLAFTALHGGSVLRVHRVHVSPDWGLSHSSNVLHRRVYAGPSPWSGGYR